MIKPTDWKVQQPYMETAKNQASSSYKADGKRETEKRDVLELDESEKILYAEYPEFKKTYAQAVEQLHANRPNVPYSALAKDGVIEYNGVVFTCDSQRNAICLGDMSNEDNVLNIPLSGGGSLRVNRNNIDQLSKAIGMFSPEDVNLIMRAIAQDAKVKEIQNEIEDNKMGIGESAEERIDHTELS